jgi:hypothetical protein
MKQPNGAFAPGSVVKRPIAGIFGLWGLFKHVGVFVGNGQVVHFAGLPGSGAGGASIVQTSLKEFADGQRVTLYAAPRNKEHAAAIIREARRLLYVQENTFNGRYDLALNNCEDFTKHCFETPY